MIKLYRKHKEERNSCNSTIQGQALEVNVLKIFLSHIYSLKVIFFLIMKER